VDKAAGWVTDCSKTTCGTGLPTRRSRAAWTTRPASFHIDRAQRSKPIADNCTTIHHVTQAPLSGCPRSPGTLSAISLEWVSAISGMRTNARMRIDGHDHDP